MFNKYKKLKQKIEYLEAERILLINRIIRLEKKRETLEKQILKTEGK